MKKLYELDLTENSTIRIKNWKQLARALGIPKSSKRIQVKRLKKELERALLAAMDKHDR